MDLQEKLTPFLEAAARAVTRSLALGAIGATFGFTWGVLRGAAVARTYTVLVGANVTLASLPCFTVRELIGDRLPDLPAAVLSGVVGGLGLSTAYAGRKAAPKGVLLFGTAGLAMQQGSVLYYAWKDRKREEIIRERSNET